MAGGLSMNGAIMVNAALDPGAFFQTWSQVSGAVDALKAGVHSAQAGIQRSARAFGQMARSARGVLSALMHTANVAQGLEAGVMNLYRWGKTCWKAFSGALDRLASNALYLKNAFGAMAAPLISAVAPAIDFVTDKLVGLFNLINQVFARLTGASTYVAAKKTADAWDSVGGRISRATSALKRYIAGFDQLNVLTDGSSGGSGGSGGGGAAGMFETREIDSALADFVDSLKAAFEASDWQALGTMLGEKVNELVDKVDWAALGAKFGFYLNGAIQTAGALLDAVNFTNIGGRIAEFLNNALAEIDFSALGATLALCFASLAETAAGFAETFDWTQLAAKLAEGLNGFVRTLGEKLDAIDWVTLALRLTDGLNTFIAETDWAALGEGLGGRINDLLAILGTAASDFDWKGAGAALATAVNGLFGSVDWEGLGRWLNDTLQGVLDFGIAFIEGFDAEGFADGVGRALAKVDWDAVARKLWQLFGAALKKLGEAFGALLLGGSADVALNLSLMKSGWTTLTAWLGVDDPLSAKIALIRKGWTSIATFVGTAVTVLTKLKKDGWKSIGGFVGTAVTVLTRLKKSGWKSIAGFVGTAVSVLTKLKKNGWTTISRFVGTEVDVKVNLKEGKISGALKDLVQHKNGVVNNGGLARYVSGVPNYSGGTTIGNLAAVSGIAYHEPVMASGSVLPYEVAAQIARTGADIQQTMDANTEDLIQTIISVIGAQTTALVSALRTNQQQNNGTGLTAQQLINQLNQRAQMFGRSPIMD